MFSFYLYVFFLFFVVLFYLLLPMGTWKKFRMNMKKISSSYIILTTLFARIIFAVLFISFISVLVNCQSSDTLASLGSLSSGQYLISADGYYQLILRSSGALVGYSVSGSTNFWTSTLPPSGRSAGSKNTFLLYFTFLDRIFSFFSQVHLSFRVTVI